MLQSPSVKLSPVKDGRRVLGEKTANASILSPSRNRTVDATATTDVPIKPLREAMPSHIVTSPRCHAGQKRTIDQVEEEDTNKPDSQGTLSTSLSRREEQFHIYEESTQSTVKSDTQHIPHLHTMEPDEQAHDQQQQRGSPQERLGIPSTPNLPKPSTPETTVPADPDARRAFIQKKATLLRSRIQNAMRHVKDPQLDRRLSELEAHSRKRPRISFPASPTRGPAEQPTSASPAKVPKLLPAPDLKPTAYSARYVSDMPSSPPASAGNETQDNMKTPTQSNLRAEPRTPGSPVQLSSPPGTATRNGKCDTLERVSAKSEYQNQVDRMVATVQNNGDALHGLLKLMKTTDRYDNLDMWTG